MYTWNEMHKSFAVWHNPTKIEHIFSILIKYACDVDARIKYDGFLESAKFCIYQGETFFKYFRQDTEIKHFWKNYQRTC